MKRQDLLIILAVCASLALLGHWAKGQAPRAGTEKGPDPQKTQGQTYAVPRPPQAVYLRHQTFCLPIGLSDADRATLQEVQLYVRRGQEGAWTCQESAPPTASEFRFQAVEDGEYWFTIASLEKGGKLTPADLGRMTPQLIVIVDTQPPEITLRSLPLSEEREAFVECKVQDANLDASRVRVEYQARDKTWKVLSPLPGSPALYRIPGTAGLVTLVRATATDRAGNNSTRMLNLPLEAVRATAAQQLPAIQAAEAKASNKPAPPLTLPKILAPGTEKESEPLRSNGQTPEPPRKLVNGTHISLDYQIEQQGPSGISKVEVWITRDGGSTWQHLCDDPDRKSPVDVDLPGEGVYGVSLVMTNGNGLGGVPPGKGDAADSWVEVDLTRPDAHLVTVRPGSGEEAGTLVVTWVASDKNLGATPIDLYYATQQSGPWLPIARGVKNDGSYRWPVPREAGSEFLIRMDVADLAGNITRCETPQPVVVDLVRPKARVLNVTVSAPRPPVP